MRRHLLAWLVLLFASSASAQATNYEKDAQGRVTAVADARGTTRYTYFEDNLIESVEHPNGTKETFRHEDLGNPPANAEQKSSPPQSSFDGSRNRFAFTGHYFDLETSLYYAKGRYYDPAIGRFLTQDSYLGDITDPPSLHRFVYTSNRPTFFVDPDGYASVRQTMFGGTNEDSYLGAFGKALAYNTWNVFSFGTLARQDTLVEQSEAGQITEGQYLARTGANAATGVAQFGLTIATGGAGITARTGLSSAAWGAAGSAAVHGTGDVGEVYGTQTKTLDEVSGYQYAGAAALGGVGAPVARHVRLSREAEAALSAELSLNPQTLNSSRGVAIVESSSQAPAYPPGQAYAASEAASSATPRIPGTNAQGAVAGGSQGGSVAVAPSRGVDVPYNPRAIAADLEARYPRQVRAHTMVPNPSRRVLHQGREILIDQRGFPVFDDVAAFQTRLSNPTASVASRPLHMKEATRLLSAAIQRGEVAVSQFTSQQLRAIQAGLEKIPGFTWHHHQQFGRMQLIPSDLHQAVGHSGGFRLWY